MSSLKEKFLNWAHSLLEEPVGTASRPVWLQVWPDQIRPYVGNGISDSPKTFEAMQDPKTGLWDIHLTSLEIVGRDYRIGVAGDHKPCDWGVVWGGLSTKDMIEKLQPFVGDRKEEDPAYFPNFVVGLHNAQTPVVGTQNQGPQAAP